MVPGQFWRQMLLGVFPIQFLHSWDKMVVDLSPENTTKVQTICCLIDKSLQIYINQISTVEKLNWEMTKEH